MCFICRYELGLLRGLLAEPSPRQCSSFCGVKFDASDFGTRVGLSLAGQEPVGSTLRASFLGSSFELGRDLRRFGNLSTVFLCVV